MKLISRTALWVVLICLSSTAYAEAEEGKPTRTECIIGFNLDWAEIAADRRHVVRNSFADRPDGEQRIRQLSAYIISMDGTRMYFQFKSDCAKKANMAAAVIDFWRSRTQDLPKFSRIKEPIVPSLNTIEVTGPYWRD